MAKKADLAILQLDTDKLGIDKLETTPVDLSKLSNVVNKEVAKKTEYNKLVKIFCQIQTIDISDLVKKSEYNTKIEEIEKKISTHDIYRTSQEFNK